MSEQDTEQEVTGTENQQEAEAVDNRKEDDLLAFDSIDEAVQYSKMMQTKKREAYQEAKGYRLELESAKTKIGELEKLMSEQSNEANAQYLAEIEALKAKQLEQEQLLLTYRQEVERQQILQAELQFKHAADKNEIQEREFLKFKWHEHLKSLTDDQEPDLDAFVTDMKTKYPYIAKQEEKATEPAFANSGLPLQAQEDAAKTQFSVKGAINKTPADIAKRNSEWEAYKKANNLT